MKFKQGLVVGGVGFAGVGGSRLNWLEVDGFQTQSPRLCVRQVELMGGGGRRHRDP